MKGITMLAFAATMLLAGTAVGGAKATLPTELPPLAPDRPVPVPQIEKKTLANGMEVWVVPRQGVPIVDVVLAVRGAGLAADSANTPGFARLFASLLIEGTETRSSREITETAQALGGSIKASASADGITISGNALAAHAPQMLALVGEVARRPEFPEQEVRLAQANALQNLKAEGAQPGFSAERALSRAIYGSHPYARTSLTEGGIRSLTPASLKAAHAARLRPERALLVVAGRITPAEAFRVAEAVFGGWRSIGAPGADTIPAPRAASPTLVLIHRPGSVQSSIHIGRPAVPAIAAEFIPLQLAGAVFGGSFSSRLMQNLREEKGYTYGARGGLDALRAGGRLSASADVRNEVTGAALDAFLREYARMGSEPVPERELEDSKRYLVGGYLINNQMQSALASSLAANWQIGLPSEFLSQYAPAIRAVDSVQVQAMGRRFFDPKTMSIVVVGDSKAVAMQLANRDVFEEMER